MPNRLINENSPYLLQHSENLVDWYPWGAEALDKARHQDKPIFLSIGYAACHWCHVMAHESFEDPEIAALMNEYFINVKVDREERPDLDSIYMTAVVAMNGNGGWPMSVFLTPSGEPFYGGTYFPPVRRYNLPSFRDVLIGVARAWKDDRSSVQQSTQQLMQYLHQSQAPSQAAVQLKAQLLEDAAFRLAQSYDWKYGGWGQAPKFPQPMVIEFLLRRAVNGDQLALDMACHALDSMALGGMYDLVGGGFSRYSTDSQWRVPHFEKMLYDNAQLATVYLHAYLLTQRPAYRRICEETLDFILRELTQAGGRLGERVQGFYSSLDADSDGGEGAYYVWSLAEIQQHLSPEQADLAIFAYGLTSGGNFDGHNVLQRQQGDLQIAERFNLGVEAVQPALDLLHKRLFDLRTQRPRPKTDDKILVAWNGLALIAFAEAARYLQRTDYLEAARQTADFILTELHPEDRLLRSWREGKANHNACLEDYAALCLGLLALYQSDPDPYWYSSALGLANEMVTAFSDPQGGFFDTRSDQTDLIVRPKDLQDNATPSGNSMAAMVLLQLSILSGDAQWWDVVVSVLALVLNYVVKYGLNFGYWLHAIYLTLQPRYEIALLGEPQHPLMLEFLKILRLRYRPSVFIAASPTPPPSNAPNLLHNRPLLDGLPTAYICQAFTCLNPTNNLEEFIRQLDSIGL